MLIKLTNSMFNSILLLHNCHDGKKSTILMSQELPDGDKHIVKDSFLNIHKHTIHALSTHQRLISFYSDL